MLVSHVTQPASGDSYIQEIGQILTRGPIEAVDIAVAYATRGGVDAFLGICKDSLGQQWPLIKKRSLIGFDYCRTDPIAADALSKLAKSTVKVHNGASIVTKKLCTPQIPFHPKVFIFHGTNRTAVLAGSGNLSASGLRKGHEVGCLIEVNNSTSPQEVSARQACQKIHSWFNGLWTSATPLGSVLSAYTSIFNSVEHLRAPAATDDDSGDAATLSVSQHRRGSLSAVDIRQLRACGNFWIEAGNLHENRGRGHAGNQLMMSRMTRVFFGFPATDVPTDTTIGSVALRFGSHIRHDCSLRFSNNSMDVLGLPIPGSEGPHHYDQENLIFTRQQGGIFDLRVGTAADKTIWRRRSEAIDGMHAMTSGRKWGVF